MKEHNINSRVKTLFLACIVTIFFTLTGFAQETAKPEAKQSPNTETRAQAAPQIQTKELTQNQKQRLASTQSDLALAQSQFAAAKARLEGVQLLVDALTRQFMLELGIGYDRYTADIQIIDEKTGALGFIAKPLQATTDDPKKPKS